MRLWTKLRLGTQVTIGFLVMTIMLAVGGAVGILASRQVNLNLDETLDTHTAAIIHLEQLDASLRAASAAERALLLSRLDPSVPAGRFTKDFDTAVGAASAALSRVKPLCPDPREAALAQEIEGAMAKWADASRAATAGAIDPAAVVSASDAGFEAVRGPLDGLRQAKAKDTTAARAGAHRQYVSVVMFMSVATLFAVILGVLFAWGITSSATGPIRDGVVALLNSANEVKSASSQVATSAQSLSQGATEQAASLEETSASMEEMSSMTRKTAEHADAVAGLMNEVDAHVQSSNTALGTMVGSMKAIQDSSHRVGKIIKTIDEIAFQTNILALNAAVEAARAGEAGMGFAVVADEVRSLAQRSARAAKDTTSLIDESIAAAEGGARDVEQVASSVATITGSVTRVKALVNEVSVATRQQAQGIDQVAQAIAQMEKVTQTTAATAEESAAASVELTAQAEASMQVVGQLEALVGGTGGARGPRPEARTPRPRLSAVRPPQPRALKLAGTGPLDPPQAAEDALPMGDTGTFGSF